VAPLLGTVALGPAFVGVAALASTPWRRAGLGAAGFVWLALAEAVTGQALLYGSPDGTLPRADWEGSISAAISDALEPLVTTPALVPALVWAAFAAVLPLVVRGRWPALDIMAAALWAVGLMAVQALLGDALAPDVALGSARGAVAGAFGAAIVALAVARLRAPAEALRTPRASPA